MAKTRVRLVSTLLAVVIGFGLVYLLTYSGEQGKGPFGKLLDRLGESVQEFEKRNIVKHRTQARQDSLSWLNKDMSVLRNPTNILLGAFDNESEESFERVLDLEDTLETNFPFVHIYTAWGSKPSQEFPRNQVKTIVELGSIPAITWEPWLTDFDAANYPKLRPAEERDWGGMKDITAGFYDTYIKTWAAIAARVESPIFLRFGHEMNDPYRYPWGPHNNKPAEFVEAWQHVHDLFKEVGANNVIWVWAPHPAYGWFDAYYPGEDYVDYVGVGVLNYGTVAHWSDWWSFDDIFGKHYPDFAKFKKPIMITEFGSLAVGGDRALWFKDALEDLPQKYPLVKSVIFFHYSKDNTLTQQELNWYFIKDADCVEAMKSAIDSW